MKKANHRVDQIPQKVPSCIRTGDLCLAWVGTILQHSLIKLPGNCPWEKFSGQFPPFVLPELRKTLLNFLDSVLLVLAQRKLGGKRMYVVT